MAWHISFFLKYLDRLEDFRKNPHVKIPRKSPCTIFQSSAKFKNQLKFQKNFFLNSGPALNSAQPWPTSSSSPATPLSLPIGPSPPPTTGPQPLVGLASLPHPLSPTLRPRLVVFLPEPNDRCCHRRLTCAHVHHLPAPPFHSRNDRSTPLNTPHQRPD
jgi:hypothetical protein